jgi:hypothetical protein
MDGDRNELAGDYCGQIKNLWELACQRLDGTFHIPFAERPQSLASQLPQVLCAV